MRKLGVLKAAALLLAAIVAGCGGSQVGSSAAGQGAMPSLAAGGAVAHQQAQPDVNHKEYAGTYNGTITWSVGGNSTNSVPLTTILHFHNKNILGPFRFTYNSEHLRYRLYGRVKSKSAQSMYIAFLIYNNNNNKGGFATGNGTISNGTFTGGAHTTPGQGPGISLRFSVTKSS